MADERPTHPTEAHGWRCELANMKIYESERAAYAAEARAWIENQLYGMARDEEFREASLNTLEVGKAVEFLLRRMPEVVRDLGQTAMDCKE